MKLSNGMKKWIAFGLITAACSCGAMTLYAMKPVQENRIRKPAPLKQVSVQSVRPGTYPAKVKAYGEVAAKWTTTLRSQVKGRITRINENLQPGKRLKTGEIILELDGTHYQEALAQARLELENARVNLIQVERQASQARADWKGSGINQAPASPLVFHEPQLKAARARVVYTQKAVGRAKNDLKQTRILAPYDGLVAQRFANKGETVFAGDQIVKLVSADQVEIGINLNASQVQRMGNWQGRAVEILDPATGRVWTGKMIREGGLVDRKTRLRRFYVVPLPEEKQTSPSQLCPADLVPGMFVTAIIQGQSRDNLLALPESSLTRDGDIWFVESEGLLQRQKAKTAFYENGNVYVENSLNTLSVLVVTAPAPGFVAGTKVAPVLRACLKGDS